jgi:hypothetical protein
LALMITGIAVKFILPAGSGARRALWGLTRHEWGDVHFWLAVALVSLLLLHLALHWQWVCITSLRLSRWNGGSPPRWLPRTIVGVCLAVFLAAGLWVFVGIGARQVATVSGGRELEAQDSGPGMGEHSRKAQPIRGSMTLGEAADALGVPVETLRTQLGLPAAADAQKRLGQLRQQYGFTMADVRKLGP